MLGRTVDDLVDMVRAGWLDEIVSDTTNVATIPEWLLNLVKLLRTRLLKSERAQFKADLAGLTLDDVNFDTVLWSIAIMRNDRMLALLADNEEPYAKQCKLAIQDVTAYCRATIDGIAKRARGNKGLLARTAVLAEQAAWKVSCEADEAGGKAARKKMFAADAAYHATIAAGRAVSFPLRFPKGPVWAAGAAARAARSKVENATKAISAAWRAEANALLYCLSLASSVPAGESLYQYLQADFLA